MNKNSNTYIIIYASVMIVVVAVLLAVASMSLADRKNANVETEKQGAILASMGLAAEADRADDKTAYIKAEYAKYIVDSYAVDSKGERVEGADAFALLNSLKAEYAKDDAERQLPVFEARLDDGTTLYVLPVYGAGLWGPIWGYIALQDDWDTIYGVSFDHKGETPGLGAEIASAGFVGQFKGKKIFDGGSFAGVSVLKGAGASAGNDNAVDAVSGGTITSRGVQTMIISCLEDYLPLIEKMRAGQGGATADAAAATETGSING